MAWRFQANNIFLTYAQCNLDKEYLQGKLLDIFTDHDIKYLRIGHELHEDNGNHLHAFAQLSKKLHTRNPRFFDVDGHHPNVQAARKPADCNTYCGKDGDFVDWGEFAHQTKKNEETWQELIAAPTKQDFWELAKTLGRDYILQHEKLEYYVEKFYNKDSAPYVARDGIYRLTPELEDWLTNEFPKVGE